MERNRPQQANDNIRAKSSNVQAPSCESFNLAHRVGSNHGEARIIEDAVPQLHHFDGSSEAASNLFRQFLPENRQLFTLRRAYVRRNISIVSIATRSKQK